MDSISLRRIGRSGVLLLIGLFGMDLAGAAAPPPQNVGRVSTPLLTQQARLQPADLSGGDHFGGGVLSADGRTALLPAPDQDCAAGEDCGAVYVFALNQGEWTQQARLTLETPASRDFFGEAALSANGDVALIGAPVRDCEAGVECGVAYVFERSGGKWSSGTSLGDPPAGDYFGSAVALSGAGDRAFVGALGENCPGTVFACGAIHIFRRTGGQWESEATLLPEGSSGNNFFGNSFKVSRDGKTVLAEWLVLSDLLVGDICIFQETGGVWNQEATLLPGDDLREFLPIALSGDGQTALIAAWTYPGFSPPLYYVYVHDGAGSWTRQGPQLPISGDGDGSGGLSFDGNTAIAGIETDGKAQLFARSGGTWSLLQELIPTEPGAVKSRPSVALSDNARTALVGLPDVDCPNGCRGAAFIFAVEGFSADIPTLGELGLAFLALLIAGSGALLLRRRRANGSPLVVR
jgi:hypothetical protein